MSVGIWEMAAVVLVVMVLFGAGKIPRAMGDLGEGIKKFRRALKEEEPENTDGN